MARPRQKTPDELMHEAFWSKYDICRVFRKAPKTIDRFIYHPNPKKRLPGLMVNGEFYAEKTKVLNYFKFVTMQEEKDGNEELVQAGDDSDFTGPLSIEGR